MYFDNLPKMTILDQKYILELCNLCIWYRCDKDCDEVV